MTLHFEVLRSKIDTSDPEVVATLDVIRREVGRLDRVVKTFLDFTRPVEPQMRPVDVAALLRDLSDLLTPQAGKRDCEVLFQAEPSHIWLCADPDMLNQALLNIMVNGIEAMDAGGALKIAAAEKNGECVITISDQGPGIDPKIRDKIFNLYFTTKGSGSGIGLAIAFQVVQLHNGTIDFSSTPGHGTSFRLQFPVYDREPSPDPR
jgi:signal transduction histidine kinase